MKKFLVLALITALYLQPTIALAQNRNKAEKEFVNELNTVLKKSARHDTGYEGVMSIDSLFAINEAGELSVTVKYTTDSTTTKVRLVAPISSIQKVRYDLYLILECADDQVQLSESKNGGPLKEVSKGNWFRVGAPIPEDMIYKTRVEKALKKMLSSYKSNKSIKNEQD